MQHTQQFRNEAVKDETLSGKMSANATASHAARSELSSRSPEQQL